MRALRSGDFLADAKIAWRDAYEMQMRAAVRPLHPLGDIALTARAVAPSPTAVFTRLLLLDLANAAVMPSGSAPDQGSNLLGVARADPVSQLQIALGEIARR
jgi:hypothetical protein